MFDTMTLVKTVGALCGALLIFMLGSWFASAIYGAGGHGAGDHAQGYHIEVGGGDAPEAEAEEEIPFAEILASADIGKGEKVFRKCSACHSLEAGANGVGPSLHGIVGRAVDSEAGYAYSGALAAVVDSWTPEHLDAFLTKPASYTPGTAMSFSGLKKVQDRANLVAYLQSVGG